MTKRFLLITGIAMAVAALSVVAADAQGRNYDARVEANALVDFAPGVEQQAALDDLRAGLPAVAASIDRATGATRTLVARGGYLSSANPGADPVSIAVTFAGANAAALGLGADDLAGYEITDDVYSAVSGASHVYLRQSYQGLPVYNGQLQVNVNRDGRVISVANAFMPNLSSSINAVRPAIAAADAVASAFAHLGVASGEPTDPGLMLLPIRRGEARLVWNFQLEIPNHHYDFTVDAVDGKVWTRFDWVADDTYRAYAAPIESPIHTPGHPGDARTLEVDPENPVSLNGWFDAGVTIMDGNNVHACIDRDASPNVCDTPEPNCAGPAPLTCDFNFPIDLGSQAPLSYQPAAVTNLFYWNNYIHDTQYLYGFDEPAGNFQENNFGLGGAGSDSVNADAQNPGNCNANFGTPPDGSNPRMQMFLCTNANPDRDGDFDNLVIVHEYTHGISNRLVGGPNNVSCLNNAQQPGEGWSDLLGLIYTHQTGFADTDARGVGSYLFDLPAVGGTIRTFPYSTSMAINPDTYATIGSRSVPHGVGSVWAELAWEAYWEVVNARGFDPDLQNTVANAGNHRMMLYLTEGMKNTACSPTFLDARDGIIQAATDNNNGDDVCLLWDGFARRGLGTDASTAGPNSRSATNGFDVPPACGGGGCRPKGAACTANSECCSNKCKGKSGSKTCKG